MTVENEANVVVGIKRVCLLLHTISNRSEAPTRTDINFMSLPQSSEK